MVLTIHSVISILSSIAKIVKSNTRRLKKHTNTALSKAPEGQIWKISTKIKSAGIAAPKMAEVTEIGKYRQLSDKMPEN